MTISVGDSTVDFALPSTSGGKVRLSEITDRGPVALLFFRGTWCSYCAEQLQTFSLLTYDMKRHLDLRILPITSDQISELVEMRNLFDLRLELLSDEDLSVSESYTDIEPNAKHGDIPVPATYVIDEDGVVQYRDIGSSPDDRTYANYVRSFVRDGYTDPYPGKFPDPYSSD